MWWLEVGDPAAESVHIDPVAATVHGDRTGHARNCKRRRQDIGAERFVCFGAGQSPRSSRRSTRRRQSAASSATAAIASRRPHDSAHGNFVSTEELPRSIAFNELGELEDPGDSAHGSILKDDTDIR